MRLQADRIIETYYKESSVKREKQKCLTCGGCCPVRDSQLEHRLTLDASGVQCKDVSMMGSLEGDAGKCMPSQSVWLHERSTFEEDVIFTECTPLWDPMVLSRRMDRKFKVLSFVLDSNSHMGDVIVRKRRLTTCINQERCYFISDPRKFVEIFGRELVASPEILWWADAGFQSVEAHDLGSRAIVVDGEPEFHWHDALTVYQRDRLLDYEAYTRRLVAEGKVKALDMHMYDLDQNCPIGYKGSTSAENPRPLKTLISHGTIWNSHLRRPLLACEWLVAHVVPGVQGHFGPDGPVDMIGLMAAGEVSPAQVRSMVGNGWHLAAVGSWMMWLLASVTRFTKESPTRVLSVETDEDCKDDAGASDLMCRSPVRKMQKCNSTTSADSPSSTEAATPSALWKAEMLTVEVL